MAHYTENLHLYEKDPATDGNDKFSITTMLNENWDKIDADVQKKILDLATIRSNAAHGELAYNNMPEKISDLIDDTDVNPIKKADTLDGLTSTIAELNYCDGVTSNIQNQLGNLSNLTTQAKSSLVAAINETLQSRANVDLSNLSEVGEAKFTGKANVDLSNSTSPVVSAPYLKTTYVNGTSGYNIWSNGYCEQWGTYYGSIGGYDQHSISLLKTYANTNYNIKVTGSPADYIVGAWVSSASSFIHSARFYDDDLGGNRTTATIFWKSSGYLASGQY